MQKIIQPGEISGWNRDNKRTVKPNPIVLTDTLFYHIQNLRQQPWPRRFVFAPVNIPAGITAYLVDKFQNSSTTVDLTDSFYRFNITADAVNSADRFILVFRQSGVVPVFIVKISATRQLATYLLTGRSQRERIQQYNIERSGKWSWFYFHRPHDAGSQ